MKKYMLLIFVVFAGCQNKQSKLPLRDKTIKPRQKKAGDGVQPVLDDSFADSTGIGKKTHNKVEISWYSLADSAYAVVRFYAKQQSSWALRNAFKLHQDEYRNPLPEITDINGDGFADVTYSSLQAANGANDVRTVFVYDPKNDRLVFIKNSENYPNMQYNKKLNCIDAFLVSGCAATVFLKLEKDTLREFASVERCDSLIVTTYDRRGKEKVILKKKADRNDFTRYKNYHPLEEAGD